MEQKVLIIGARGRLGSACVNAFSSAGWQVIAQARRPNSSSRGVRFIDAPLTDHATLACEAAGAAVVLHAANPLYTNAAWRRDAQPMLDHVIEVAKLLNATLLFPGNVYNFGADLPAHLTEQTPQAATTVKGRIRIALECSLQDAAVQGLQCVVLRAGDFFGADGDTWLDLAMMKDITQGRFVYPGPLNVPHAWAYLPDLANAFVAAANARSCLPAFSTLHFAGHTLTGQDWIDALTPIAREQGWLNAHHSLKLGNLPWPLLRAGGVFVPTWRSLTELQYLWNKPHALTATALITQLGAVPNTPFAQALHDSLSVLGLLRTPSNRGQTLPA
jgi:nucleoside-diphosphate-sugar epimerase